MVILWNLLLRYIKTFDLKYFHQTDQKSTTSLVSTCIRYIVGIKGFFSTLMILQTLVPLQTETGVVCKSFSLCYIY